LITDGGVLDLEVPHDKNAEFTPVLVPKRQTMVNGLDQKIFIIVIEKSSVRIKYFYWYVDSHI
jgi:transposase-like protein